MVAHLTANQQSWVRIHLLPSTRQTLSILRWVATWDCTVLALRGGRGTQYTQKTLKIFRKKSYTCLHGACNYFALSQSIVVDNLNLNYIGFYAQCTNARQILKSRTILTQTKMVGGAVLTRPKVIFDLNCLWASHLQAYIAIPVAVKHDTQDGRGFPVSARAIPSTLYLTQLLLQLTNFVLLGSRPILLYNQFEAEKIVPLIGRVVPTLVS